MSTLTKICAFLLKESFLPFFYSVPQLVAITELTSMPVGFSNTAYQENFPSFLSCECQAFPVRNECFSCRNGSYFWSLTALEEYEDVSKIFDPDNFSNLAKSGWFQYLISFVSHFARFLLDSQFWLITQIRRYSKKNKTNKQFINIIC